jgi:hypothetical protein
MAQDREPGARDDARAQSDRETAGLMVLNATLEPEQAPPSLETPGTSKYDPEQSRDRARAVITYWLLGLLTALFIASFATYLAMPDKTEFANLKALLEMLISPLIVLVSAATGFYFGAHSSNKNN